MAMTNRRGFLASIVAALGFRLAPQIPLGRQCKAIDRCAPLLATLQEQHDLLLTLSAENIRWRPRRDRSERISC